MSEWELLLLVASRGEYVDAWLVDADGLRRLVTSGHVYVQSREGLEEVAGGWRVKLRWHTWCALEPP